MGQAEYQRALYASRKEAGRCTRCGDDAPNALHCAPCGERERARKRTSQKLRRQRLRAAGRCVDCGAAGCKTARCERCLMAARRLSAAALRALSAGGAQSVAHVETQGHAERTESDGYTRTRYHGRARRGAPGKLASDAVDLRYALACIRRGEEGLVAAAGITDRRARAEAELTALGQVDLGQRFLADVLTRHRYADKLAGDRQRARLTARMRPGKRPESKG